METVLLRKFLPVLISFYNNIKITKILVNFEEYESADFALQCKIKGFTTKIIFVKNFYFSLRKIEKYSFVEISVTDYYKNWEAKWKNRLCFHKFKRKKIILFLQEKLYKIIFLLSIRYNSIV